MKIRSAFVSNSSSSSFMVLGIVCSQEFMEAVKKQWLIKIACGADIPEKIRGCEHSFSSESQKFCPECGKPIWIDNPKRKEILRSYHFFEYLEGEGLVAIYTDNENSVVGIDPCSLDENMTILEHKKRLAKMLKTIANFDIDVSQIDFINGTYQT